MNKEKKLVTRYCVTCLCFRPISEFLIRGRKCLQCRDPKKDKSYIKKWK